MVVDDGKFLATAAQVDDRFGRVVDRARIIAGRGADQRKPEELTIGESLAEQMHVGIGDTLAFRTYSPADIEALERGEDAAPGRSEGDVPGRGHRAAAARPRGAGGDGRGARADRRVRRADPPTASGRSRAGSCGCEPTTVRADIPKVSAVARRLFGEEPA